MCGVCLTNSFYLALEYSKKNGIFKASNEEETVVKVNSILRSHELKETKKNDQIPFDFLCKISL